MAYDSNGGRSWQAIAEEASRELDPNKLQKLSEELEQALDEQQRKLRPSRTPESKTAQP
jgi:hypothetical protein